MLLGDGAQPLVRGGVAVGKPAGEGAHAFGLGEVLGQLAHVHLGEVEDRRFVQEVAVAPAEAAGVLPGGGRGGGERQESHQEIGGGGAPHARGLLVFRGEQGEVPVVPRNKRPAPVARSGFA